LSVVLQLLMMKVKGYGMHPPWLTLVYYSRIYLQEPSRTAKIHRMSGVPI